MSIVISITIALVIVLGIISVINAAKLEKLQRQQYRLEKRALSHFTRLMNLNNMVKKYEIEGKSFMSIEDIKRTINSDKTI